MQVQSGHESSRYVPDDIDSFRMKSSYEDEEQSLQGTRATACSQATKECSISYEYRSRDEVANAILKLRGKEKHAEYINTVRQAQRAKWQQNPRRDVAEISKGASEPEMISKVVTPSHSFGTVPEQEYPSQNNRIDPKTEPTFTNTESTKTKPAGLFGTLFRCGFCATDAQLPDFNDFEEVKEYSVEGVADHIQEMKMETKSQYLSPQQHSAHIRDAPCNVEQHSESIGGCSTITHSVAGKIAVRVDSEKVRGYNASTKKHSNISTHVSSASSLLDRDVEAGDDGDDQLVDEMPSLQVHSHGQMFFAEYESLGLSSKATYSTYSKRSMDDRSASLSLMSFSGKGSSMGLSSASELGTETLSQSFSHTTSQDGDTFSSDSFSSASEEASDYTLSDRSSIDDSFTPSSYVTSMQEDDSMTYGTLSGSSSESYDE